MWFTMMSNPDRHVTFQSNFDMIYFEIDDYWTNPDHQKFVVENINSYENAIENLEKIEDPPEFYG
jgi:hypothetical protein